jgi:hypothetical protein
MRTKDHVTFEQSYLAEASRRHRRQIPERSLAPWTERVVSLFTPDEQHLGPLEVTVKDLPQGRAAGLADV